MVDLSLLLERLLWGIALGSFCFLLRSNIDTRKGVLIELAAVALPVSLAAMCFQFQAFTAEAGAERQLFGTRLAVVLQFIFLSLPVFVVSRLVERLLRGEALQLPDLFRLTTIICLATFALTTFVDLLDIDFVASVLITYFMGEWATASSRPWRAWSLATVAATGLWLFLLPASLHFNLGLMQNEWPLARGLAESVLARLALAAGVLCCPCWLATLVRKSAWLHYLSWRIAAWRFSLANPQDQISARQAVQLWHFRPGTCYLNHGSFGAVPLVVRDVQRRVRTAMEDQPMDFLSRHAESRWLEARFELAMWLGTQPENVALCENATAAMNELAAWFPLQAGHEVILNDHEYGAVLRIWKRKCESVGANLQIVELPINPSDQSQQAIVDAILERCSSQTQLVVASHITSPTAIRLPVETLCRRLKAKGISSCIDGPHALLQEDVNLIRLGCDFYTASCHKWLCSPLGSGFLYVAPEWHSHVKPCRLSWGRLPPTERKQWSDELLWTGTRDYSPYLCIPDAIRFFETFGRKSVDLRNHALASYARRRLLQIEGTSPVTLDSRDWYGWMVAIWLPAAIDGSHDSLQQRLFEQYRIEVPIVRFGDRYLVRVSCHLHTTTAEVDFLCRALSIELKKAAG